MDIMRKDYRWQSPDYGVENLIDPKKDFAKWFNEQYLGCKMYIHWLAAKDGILPEELSYDVEMVEDRWDFFFVVMAHTVSKIG